MKKALITGVSGFAGSFLAEALLDKDAEVLGTYLNDKSLSNLGSLKDKVSLSKVDLLEKENVRALIEKSRPDLIFHLAALSSPSDSFKDPSATLVNNVLSQVNLLEAIKEYSPDAKILIVSSGDVYGKVKKEDIPINENVSLNPVNPYSVSKIAQDYLALSYFNSYKLNVIRVRPFNHIGPRQGPNFVVASFAKQIAEIEKGQKEPVILVGNLESRRDFTDVRDMVKAYILALEKGEEGQVYNIGSGASHKISQILDVLLSLSNKEIKVEVHESKMRAGDEEELRCDPSKFVKRTGWKPEIPLEITLKDILEYWRNIL